MLPLSRSVSCDKATFDTYSATIKGCLFDNYSKMWQKGDHALPGRTWATDRQHHLAATLNQDSGPATGRKVSSKHVYLAIAAKTAIVTAAATVRVQVVIVVVVVVAVVAVVAAAVVIV